MKRACANCGKERRVEQMFRSQFTGARYCAVDMQACEKRARRRIAKALREASKRKEAHEETTTALALDSRPRQLGVVAR